MKKLITCVLTLPLLLMSCQENEIIPSNIEETSQIKFNGFNVITIDVETAKEFYSKKTPSLHAKNAEPNKNTGFQNYINSINESLVDYGFQLAKMELLGSDGAAGITFDFNNVGNKQFEFSDWVPNDPRNYIPGSDLVYYSDGTELATTSGMLDTDTYSSINSAMNTWANVTCSEGLGFINAGRTDAPIDGIIFNDVGLVQWQTGLGGKPWVVPGTILHAGILPIEFFDAISGGNGNGILAATFTWVWGSPNGPTDIDNNGKNDTFAKEIYYNDRVFFQDAPDDVIFNGIVDFETVVLHEVGHALSQTHFGKAFERRNGEIHFAPFAIMNAGYSIAQREITATDNAGHCGLWGSWPNE